MSKVSPSPQDRRKILEIEISKMRELIQRIEEAIETSKLDLQMSNVVLDSLEDAFKSLPEQTEIAVAEIVEDLK
jgi:septal ring factor EnvC (AmiA/AmiB activator)